MSRRRIAAAGLVAGVLLAPAAPALELPPEGQCPPYPAPGGPSRDAPPRDLEPGERIDRAQLWRLRDYLPAEVWQHRALFFFDGQELEIGPCQRRYAAPAAFEQATREARGRARLDADGRLLGAPAAGLPFAPAAIASDDPMAGARWAWSHRHRWLGGGLQGRFRIRHVPARGRREARFEGELRWQPFHGLPALAALEPRRSLAIAGRFDAPAALRGLAWRQLRPRAAELDPARSDDVFVWLPASRRVRRAPQPADGGIWVPDYLRATQGAPRAFALPDPAGGGSVERAEPALRAVRRGFAGLLLRPPAWAWTLEQVRDLVAPLNVDPVGAGGRSFGPTGLSLADARWEVRRAVLLRARRRGPGPVRELALWIDAQTLAPLYLVTRDAAGRALEIGIHAGSFSGDDPARDRWPGSGPGSGAILPVAQSVWTAHGPRWTREWLEIRSGPPTPAELRELLSTRDLGR